MSMKLQYVNGCVYNSLLIDGAETINIDIPKLRNVLKQLIDKEEDMCMLQYFLKSILEVKGTYECSEEQCECCGDFIESYTLDADI